MKEKLVTKHVMLEENSLAQFDELVGLQNRSAVLRKLINFYIENHDLFKEEKISQKFIPTIEQKMNNQA